MAGPVRFCHMDLRILTYFIMMLLVMLIPSSVNEDMSGSNLYLLNRKIIS